MSKADKRDLQSIGSYSASEVAKLAGVSARRIGSWARYGIMPSISAKRPRIYSYADAGEAILVHYLIDQGLRAKDVRRIVEHLRERFGLWPLATAPIAHDGRLVVIKEGNDLYFDVREHPEHQVISQTLVDLKVVREALARGGWVALKTPREHIQVDPDLNSGTPVIRGRRVPTTTVAALASTAEGRALLAEDYELSQEEVEEAVGYERDIASIAA